MSSSENQPMKDATAFESTDFPRCGAKTRRGTPCRKPPAPGKRRCRMHGGAPGSGAQKGNTNALKHGFYTAEAKAERESARRHLEEMQNLLQAFSGQRR